jgi:hypothetical protein
MYFDHKQRGRELRGKRSERHGAGKKRLIKIFDDKFNLVICDSNQPFVLQLIQ